MELYKLNKTHKCTNPISVKQSIRQVSAGPAFMLYYTKLKKSDLINTTESCSKSQVHI